MKSPIAVLTPQKLSGTKASLFMRLMGTDKRIIDSQNVLGIPCSEILFLDDASALLDDFGKLRFIRNSNDRLNRRIILRFFSN